MSLQRRAFVVALLGAESTGKTTLAAELAQAFQNEGLAAAHVPEYLRTFCDTHRRTPQAHEQAHIAREQTRLIAVAAQEADIVLADTTAVMTAVYSDMVYSDTGLYAQALDAHTAGCDFTLLTALDLPWLADGLQRDGPHVRVPVDEKVRAALRQAGLPYAVVAGSGPARLAAARAAIEAARRPRPLSRPAWRHMCTRCGDGDCERHLFNLSDRTGRTL